METHPSTRPQPLTSSGKNAGIVTTAAVIGFSAIPLVFYFTALANRLEHWQYAVIALCWAQTAVAGIYAYTFFRRNGYHVAETGLLSVSYALTLGGMACLLQSLALPLALLYLVYALILSTAIANSTRGTSTIIMGLITAIAIALAGSYLQGYQIALPRADVLVPAFLNMLIMVYIALLALQIVSAPLSIRLTTAFLALVLVTLSISSAIQNRIAVSRMRADLDNSLKSTANEVAIVLDSFVSSNLEIIASEANNPAFRQYLSIPSYDPDQELPEREMRAALNLLQTRESAERKFLSSYALLNADGRNVFDTLDRNTGAQEAANDYFRIPMRTGEAYYSPVLFDESGNAYLYFSAPILDSSRRNVIGVLRSRYNALVLQRIATHYSRLISFNSHVVIYDENLVRLADDFKPVGVYTSVVDFTPQEIQELLIAHRLPLLEPNQGAGNPELARLLNTAAGGATATIEMEPDNLSPFNLPESLALATPRLQSWKVVYVEADYGRHQIEQAQARTSILITAAMLLVVGLMGIGAARILARPLLDLTQTAVDISAGNLNAKAAYNGSDEYGTLGAAFNAMTDRLRSLINELEERVAQRTLELERRNQTLSYRSTQLQTVAEVARGIVTSQELDVVLDSITELISSRFGFYHVGIFLLDENKEFAVLRAANSEGGKRMLTRKHMLKVGRVGIVGYVTGSGEARIATDVGIDAVYFNNPDLPLTRSEMALPLRIGDQVIGALDVQSTTSNAFTSEDIALFSTLADQVAVAIQNNELYASTSRALAEAQAVHRQYLRQEWQADASSRRNRAFRYTSQGLAVSSPAPLSMEQSDAYQAGDPVSYLETQPDGSVRQIMEVPIHLRGETIGAIRILDEKVENPSSVEHPWSPDEIGAMHDIAQQVGVALENARLFESTLQRADRERKVLEITGRIRSTNDPQEMLEIAAAELQRALGATRAQIILRQDGQTSAGQTSPDRANPLASES